MSRVVRIISVLLFLVSCSNGDRNCNPTQLLFPKPPDTSSLVFSIEDIWEDSDSISSVLCEKGFFQLKVKVDSLYVLFQPEDLLNVCPGMPTYCGPLKQRDRVEVLVNSENTILFEGEVHRIEEIDSLFQEIYLNATKNSNYILRPKSSAITVKWDVSASQNVVKEVIKELAFAYGNCIARQYPNTTGAALCDSVSLHKEQLMNNFPFNLQLHFGRNLMLGGRIPPPPPPPPQL
jgi:hypothetical protein